MYLIAMCYDFRFSMCYEGFIQLMAIGERQGKPVPSPAEVSVSGYVTNISDHVYSAYSVDLMAVP